MNTFSLVGKTALVAGASRGIGLEIARHMAAAGASVILAARSKEALEAFLPRYGAAQGRLAPLIEAFSPADLIAWAAGLGHGGFAAPILRRSGK